MATKPIGIYLLCAFFVLTGVYFVIFGLSELGFILEGLSGASDIHRSILSILLLETVVWGVVGIYAAIMLWQGAAAGRTAGFVWVVLLVGVELFTVVWALTGPEFVRDGYNGIGSTMYRFAVAGIVFVYLWRNARWYVEGRFVGSSPDRRPWN